MMELISESIDQVRTAGLPAGVGERGEIFEQPHAILVRWRSSLKEKFYRIYVNGVLAGRTQDTEQREAVVFAPAGAAGAVRIRVFAVEPEDCGQALPVLPEAGCGNSGRVRLEFLRSQGLPIDAYIEIYSNGGSGEIDYGAPVNADMIWLWPDRSAKAGFGMARFGDGDFGLDSAAAAGFGKGSFGRGEFGLDAESFEWVSPALDKGSYRFAAVVVDSAGNRSPAAISEQVAVVAPPQAVGSVELESFDMQSNEMVLKLY